MKQMIHRFTLGLVRETAKIVWKKTRKLCPWNQEVDENKLFKAEQFEDRIFSHKQERSFNNAGF